MKIPTNDEYLHIMTSLRNSFSLTQNNFRFKRLVSVRYRKWAGLSSALFLLRVFLLAAQDVSIIWIKRKVTYLFSFVFGLCSCCFCCCYFDNINETVKRPLLIYFCCFCCSCYFYNINKTISFDLVFLFFIVIDTGILEIAVVL